MTTPDTSAVENKLHEIAERLKKAAISLSRESTSVNSDEPPVAHPLKVTVAKPFKEDYQGYFVLNLVYDHRSPHLEKHQVLLYTGVKGSSLKAQVWSSNTFQLLIPKYQSDRDSDGADQTQGGGLGQMHPCRSGSALVLILLKLFFGIVMLQMIGTVLIYNTEDIVNKGSTTDDKTDKSALSSHTELAFGVAMAWVRQVAISTCIFK